MNTTFFLTCQNNFFWFEHLKKITFLQIYLTKDINNQNTEHIACQWFIKNQYQLWSIRRYPDLSLFMIIGRIPAGVLQLSAGGAGIHGGIHLPLHTQHLSPARQKVSNQ